MGRSAPGNAQHVVGSAAGLAGVFPSVPRCRAASSCSSSIKALERRGDWASRLGASFPPLLPRGSRRSHAAAEQAATSPSPPSPSVANPNISRAARAPRPLTRFFFIVPPPLRVGSCGSSHFLAAGPSRDSLLTRTRTGKKPEEEDVRGATAPVLRRRRRGRG